MEQPSNKIRRRFILIPLLMILCVLVVWEGPARLCGKYARLLVFYGGSNDLIDRRVRFVFREGASATWCKPLLLVADEAMNRHGLVLYCFGYRGRDYIEAERCAMITVDTNRNAITEVKTFTWIQPVGK